MPEAHRPKAARPRPGAPRRTRETGRIPGSVAGARTDAPLASAPAREAPPDLRWLQPKVVAVGEKYGYDAAHAAQVAALARGIFRALTEVHGLAPEWEAPLEHAALLHDIGYFVHARRHHRHGAYLIRRDALLDDYPAEWRALVALVARNHRRRPRSAPRAWGRERAGAAAALAAILRIADGLDYGHDGAARLRGARVRRGGLEVTVAGVRLGALERVLRKKSALFARTFALPVAFAAAPEDPGA